jgi:hypothetical protein
VVDGPRLLGRWPRPSGRRRQRLRRSMRTNVRISRARIATGRGNGSKNASFKIREASRARAPDSPVPGEGRKPERPGRRRTLGAHAPRVGLSLTGLVSRVGVDGEAGFEHHLPQGCGNGFESALAENPGGDPKSRLWAAVVKRVHGCTNSLTRRRRTPARRRTPTSSGQSG